MSEIEAIIYVHILKALELLQKVDVGCMTKVFDVDVSRV